MKEAFILADISEPVHEGHLKYTYANTPVKETYIHTKRDLHTHEKRTTYWRTYLSLRTRDTSNTYANRPVKDTYVHTKRDPQITRDTSNINAQINL